MRICGTTWHEEIELKPFQKCPKCKSEAYHLNLIISEIDDATESNYD